MLRELTIKNFRGISEGYIEGFGELNVFVGRNNSGKSSVLEALYILLNPDNYIKEERMVWIGFCFVNL